MRWAYFPTSKGLRFMIFCLLIFRYKCPHGLCNTHHLRELTFVYEVQGQVWAKHMIDCLLDIKKAVDEAKRFTDSLPEKQIRKFEKRYKGIL